MASAHNRLLQADRTRQTAVSIGLMAFRPAPLAMLACLLLPAAAAADDPAEPISTDLPGLVIAYGTPLNQPYVFRLEGDVLTVNGFPLFPPAVPPPPSLPLLDPGGTRAGILHPHFDGIRDEFFVAMSQATSLEAAVDSAMSVLSRSKVVTSVERVGHSGIRVALVGRPGLMDISLGAGLARFRGRMGDAEAPSPEMIAEVRATEQKAVELVASLGALRAFGYDYVISFAKPAGIVMRRILAGSSSADSAAVAAVLREERLMEDIRNPPALADLRKSQHLSPEPPAAEDE